MIACATFCRIEIASRRSRCSFFLKGGNLMKLRRQIFLAFAIALFVCASASTTFASVLQTNSSYAQRKVSSGKFPIHSACMMPPEGHLAKIILKSMGFRDVQEIPQESKTWSDDIEAMVESHLKARGINVTSATNPLSSGASADAIKEVIAQVQLKLKAVSALMYKKPGAIAKSAYTLGDQVGMLPCSENSDILVFVQGMGQVLTDGRAGMNLLIGGPAEAADVFITMADAKTGEIIGLIRLYPGSGFLHPTDDTFAQSLDDNLAIINIGSARKNAKAHGR